MADAMGPEWVEQMLADAKAYAADTVVPDLMLDPEFGVDSYDDVLMAYHRFSPPRAPDPNWKPPTWREPVWWRIKRHEANRRLQQYIHDHWLPESHCDC